MKINIISDLHLQNDDNLSDYPIYLDSFEKSDILVIAGDIGTSKNYKTIIDKFKVQEGKIFNDLIWIKGNHDYWGIGNKSILPSTNDNQIYIIDDVAFICSPMWTPIFNTDLIEAGMNDYNFIHDFSPRDSSILFYKNAEWILSQIEFLRKQSKKIVVVTHTTPIQEMIDRKFYGNSLNEAFCVMDPVYNNKFKDANVSLWICGHSHTFCDITIGETRFVRNPLGYVSFNEQTNFKKNFIVDI